MNAILRFGKFYAASDVDDYRKRVRALVLAAKRVVKISDRKHDAWDALKQAIEKLEE